MRGQFETRPFTRFGGWISVAGCWLAMALPAGARGEEETAEAEPYADNACISCHRDLPGRSSEIVELEWKMSVHYDAGVTCDGCHGGDPTVRREYFETKEDFKNASHLQRSQEYLIIRDAEEGIASPARGRNISYLCGKCHALIKEKHLGSPHGDFGEPSCLYCHGGGSHLIKDATVDIIDTRDRAEDGRCSACHLESTMEAVSRIKKILIETGERIEDSGELYQQLEEWGYHNLELESLHHHVEEVNSKLRRVFHSFNMLEINGFAQEIKEIADRTTATAKLIQSLREVQRRQTLIGLGAVVLLLAFAGLLTYYKKAFLEAEHD